jgi:hypothetical protein
MLHQRRHQFPVGGRITAERRGCLLYGTLKHHSRAIIQWMRKGSVWLNPLYAIFFKRQGTKEWGSQPKWVYR